MILYVCDLSLHAECVCRLCLSYCGMETVGLERKMFVGGWQAHHNLLVYDGGTFCFAFTFLYFVVNESGNTFISRQHLP